MKCPNCGEEMAEGMLYCEHCGEDIHIVPDYEPELERSMELTMNGILEDLHEEEHVSLPEDSPEDYDEDIEEDFCGYEWEESEEDFCEGVEKKPVPGKRGLKLLTALAIVILLAGTAGAWMVHNYNSEEYLLNRALEYVAAEKYDKAISCYVRALELDVGNIEITFDLAEVYLLKNNKVEYEYLLREIIKDKNATIEQLDSAFGKLIAIYGARGDYQTINDLLISCDNEALKSTYQGYIAREPEFSVLEGYYTSIQPLKLTVIGTGKIYYTMDGSVPDEDSSQYTAPIILDNGDYIISAYFVNERGVSSNVVTKEYHINNDEILPPEINALSGVYHYPFQIEVLNDEEDVYYTTDGSDPTGNSIPYSGPISMPLGKSNFRFAKVVDGVTGTIEERNYELILNTDFTPDQAVASIVEYSMKTGNIFDEEGHYDESGNMYQYEYQYVTTVNKSSDCYVIMEILRGVDGSAAKTGNHFAVNVYTGQRYKLQQDRYGSLFLIDIESELDHTDEESDEEDSETDED